MKKGKLIIGSMIIVSCIVGNSLFIQGASVNNKKTIAVMSNGNNTVEGVENSIVYTRTNENEFGKKTKNAIQKTKKKQISLKNFYGYDLPLVFSLSYKKNKDGNYVYSVSKKGNYYLVKGSLICPECIQIDVLDKLEIGDRFTTGSGRGYTITNRTTYNNNQREKVSLIGDDKKKYEIVNLPAFQADAYTGTPYYVIRSKNEKNYQTIFENVTLRIKYNTKFTEGMLAGETFRSIVESGAFEDISFEIAYDIHFSKKGKIDILTPSDVGSNGPWGGSDTKVWKSKLI